MRDISDRLRAEEDRQRALEDSRRFYEQREDFVAVMSHQLRTPVSIIQSFVAMLDRDDVTPEIRRKCIDAIERQCEALAEAVDQLMKIMVFHTSRE